MENFLRGQFWFPCVMSSMLYSVQTIKKKFPLTFYLKHLREVNQGSFLPQK